MLRPVMMVAGAGFLGVILYKFLWLLMLPLVGMFIGFIVFMLKLALIAAFLYAAYKLTQKFLERPAEG
jgi:hypothetical protein